MRRKERAYGREEALGFAQNVLELKQFNMVFVQGLFVLVQLGDLKLKAAQISLQLKIMIMMSRDSQSREREGERGKRTRGEEERREREKDLELIHFLHGAAPAGGNIENRLNGKLDLGSVGGEEAFKGGDEEGESE